MDTADWRDRLKPHSRKRSVKRIMNAVKQYHHLDDDELHELEKCSRSLEQKTFAVATSMLDYLRQITTEAVSMERKMQEELFQKIQILKELYLTDLNEMFQRISFELQQFYSHPQQAESDKLKKLTIYKARLEDFISFLLTSRSKIAPAIRGTIIFYENKIKNFMVIDRPWILSLQPGQVPSRVMNSLPQPAQVESNENQINSEGQSQEAYQRIQMLKEMYLPELNDIHQRIADKVGQLDSNPQQAGSVSIRMVKMFKEVMESNIAFLRTSKGDISPTLGEELATHEKQIMRFIDLGRLIPVSYRDYVIAQSSRASSSGSKAAQ